MSVASDAEATVRAAVVIVGGIGALWATIRLLWRLQRVIEARFDAVLTRALADVTRLAAELDEERRSCKAQIDALRARIAELERR
jgi:NAD-specific glutamate dehydrogenase